MSLADELRAALVGPLQHGSWANIEESFRRVGLQWRDDLQPGWGKPRYVEKVLAELPDEELPKLAKQCLDHLDIEITMGLQDALWQFEAGGKQVVTQLTRRALLRFFANQRICGSLSLADFQMRVLQSGWPPAPTGGGLEDYTSDGIILRRAYIPLFDVQPVGAISVNTAEFLEEWGFLDWPDKRLLLFLEAVVHPAVRQDEEQRVWVHAINECIRHDMHMLEERERQSGHPIYRIVLPIRGVSGRPKNLIFASTGPKPTVGLVDAINNDIVVLDNEEYCLVYDDPITEDGLAWDTLVQWWMRTQQISDEAEARQSLGQRLRQALSKESPPERLLFDNYFRVWKERLAGRLPALIPQVYLHYDPKTFGERGQQKKFPLQRIDFLMLLPARARIVIEVDGQMHYSTGDGKASPIVYAETVRGDRQLRLAGYEVYRFAGIELQGSSAQRVLTEFFTALFRRHRISW